MESKKSLSLAIVGVVLLAALFIYSTRDNSTPPTTTTLQKELLARVQRIEKQVELIISGAEGLVDAYREKLRKRVTELLEKTAIDETRLAQEVAYLAERSDITEEITRLKSHLVQLRELLSGDNEIGKKLDFLLQETNREANTILSKSAELSICDAAIEIKTEVEKLREQANNVE